MDHSQTIVEIYKRGLVPKSEVFAALQKWADELGKPGESPAQRFARAFADGPASRIEPASEIIAAFNKLGQRQTA